MRSLIFLGRDVDDGRIGSAADESWDIYLHHGGWNWEQTAQELVEETWMGIMDETGDHIAEESWAEMERNFELYMDYPQYNAERSIDTYLESLCS